MKSTGVVVNVIAYHCAWVACVLGTAQHRPALGLSVALATLLVHLHAAHAPRRELALIGVAVALGLAFESGLLATGWVRMQDTTLVGGFMPLLMVVLWGAFATTLNVALRSLRRRYAASAVIAAVFAPLAYVAGAKLGALEWVSATPALLLISAAWAALLPLLMRTAQHFDGFATS